MAFVGGAVRLGNARVSAAPGVCRSGGIAAARMTIAPSREETKVAQPAGEQQPKWKVRLLYDSDCPLCMREVNFLTKKDAGRGIIDFVDIVDLGYSPEDNQGISFEEAMGRIHAILPDGRVITGVEVFREVYSALGMGWVYAITKVPGIGQLADSVYNLWADARLRLTGRKDLAELIKEREEQLAQLSDCETSCKIEW
mmetsp:Transcript_251/g.799  ORF Transcript_251/g.799 Transcript_251/m.799 type:complete len:198 (-) Transcript_251:179-772(-)|eukprot:CAMPEP_0198731634 /NCGR_PEP_ID=MMETSP1475-20131203/31129_1 /TAXON_ID= ORGANISM="Unidentified sp., Strain CCMP1999" /NCGR_SAMPLE_ID=MMETSP1475 /ASSEMBLY_ACC=CAM_ASM_001111 /LENGTH=197 /DNA_ID=CAMNT_0044494623 /DNA_START=93 /DNA_END=683 /DNA_ORIENTATION=+